MLKCGKARHAATPPAHARYALRTAQTPHPHCPILRAVQKNLPLSFPFFNILQ
jgi:hypothetical protein